MNDATPLVVYPDELSAALLIATTLALPISMGLVSWFRRSPLHAADTGAAPSDASPIATRASDDASSHGLVDLSAEPCSREILRAGRDAWIRPWHAALVYAVAGATFAMLTTIVQAIVPGAAPLRISSFALSFWTFFWPAVIGVNLVAGATPSTRLDVVAAYFAVFAGIAAFELARAPDLDWRGLIGFWLLVDAVPTALLGVFLMRPLRAVGPLVFALVLVAAATAQGSNGESVSLGTRVAATVLVAGILGFLASWGIGALRMRGQLGEQPLLMASIWLVFGVIYVLASVRDETPRWIGGGAAFAGYLVVSELGHAVLRRKRRGTASRGLLLLRVSTRQARSERLFDALARHWLHVGAVARVASRTTPATGELVDFVRRRHATGEPGWDRAQGPDGRFRIHTIPAGAAAQHQALREVGAQNDVVLADLRQFAHARFQSTTEFDRILDTIDLAQLVFVIADRGDRNLLEALLNQGWQRLAPDSPNRQPGTHVARLVGDPADSPAALRKLLGILAS